MLTSPMLSGGFAVPKLKGLPRRGAIALQAFRVPNGTDFNPVGLFNH